MNWKCNLQETKKLSEEAPFTYDSCEKCGKLILVADFRQCRVCGGYYDRACYVLHEHDDFVLFEPPKHPWKGDVSVPCVRVVSTVEDID